MSQTKQVIFYESINNIFSSDAVIMAYRIHLCVMHSMSFNLYYSCVWSQLWWTFKENFIIPYRSFSFCFYTYLYGVNWKSMVAIFCVLFREFFFWCIDSKNLSIFNDSIINNDNKNWYPFINWAHSWLNYCKLIVCHIFTFLWWCSLSLPLSFSHSLSLARSIHSIISHKRIIKYFPFHGIIIEIERYVLSETTTVTVRLLEKINQFLKMKRRSEAIQNWCRRW